MYHLFLLYTHKDPPLMAEYLQLEVMNTCYSIFVHAGRFIAMQDCLSTIPSQRGRYILSHPDYLIEIDDHGVYLGIASSLVHDS